MHVGYTNDENKLVGMSNALGFRVALAVADIASSNNISLSGVTNVTAGSSSNMVLAFTTGMTNTGLFSSTLDVVYGDSSSLAGAIFNCGTNHLTVTGQIYSGQAFWRINGAGNWTSLAAWDANGGTPGLDGALSMHDTATFGTYGSGNVTLNTNATLSALTFSNAGSSYLIAGNGTLTMQSAGEIANLYGSNTIATALALTTNVTLSNNALFTVSGNIDGAGGLTQYGTGTTILSGNNSYAGATLIGGGTMLLNGTNRGNGAVTVTNSGTLGGTGSISGPVAVSTGGTLSPGTNSMTINGGLSMDAGSYLWSLYANTNAGVGNFTAPLLLNGSLSVSNGTLFGINLTNAVNTTDPFWMGNRSWTVMSGSNVGAGTNFTTAFVPGSYTTGFVTDEFKFTASNNSLFLDYLAPVTFVATNTTNITVVVSTNNKVIQTGAGTTTLGGSNASSLSIIVNSGTINAVTNTTTLSPLVNLTVNAGTFGVQNGGTNTLNDFTVNGGTVAVAPNAIVSVTNSFAMTGGDLSGGTYQATNYIFTPSISATVGATLTNAGSASWALVSNSASGVSGVTVFSSSMAYTGGTLITNSTLQLGNGSFTGSVLGVVTNNGVLQNGSSNSLFLTDLSTNITGNGIIAQAGTGTMTLDAASLNNFTGSFAVNTNGTLSVTNTNSLGGATNIYVTAGGTVQFRASATNLLLPIEVTGASNAIGVIQNAGTGTLALNGTLTKSGSVLVLAGGNFAVNGQVTGSGAPGSFNSDLVVSNATVTLNASNNNYSGPTYVVDGGLLIGLITNALPTNTVVIVGTASDTNIIPNIYTLSADQTLAGIVSVDNGRDNIIAGPVSSTVATLTINGATNTTFAGVIEDQNGVLRLIRSGTGSTLLSGANTYSGGTTINNGRIITQNAQALGTGGVALNGGTLEVRSLLTIGSITWSGGQVALPTLTSTNGIYVASTNGLTLTNSYHVFNLTGASLTIGTPTALLGATNIMGYSTNDFSVTGVGRYELLLSNNILWIEALNAPVPAYPNFVIPGLTDNQTQVAQAMNVWADSNPTGDKATVLSALTNIPTSQWAAAYDQMSPRFYQQMATISFNLANAQYNELVQRLYGLRVAGTGFSMTGFADNTMVLEGQGDGEKNPKNDILRPGLDSHWGMFLDGNGIFAKANSGNMLPGYNFQSGGITTGLTYKWNESFGSGIYAGYQGAYSKNNGLGTLIDNAVKFGLFGSYGTPDGKGLYADGLIGGGYNNYQVSRSIQFGSINRTANSTPGAGELDSMLAAGYNWRKGNWSYGPVGSLQYTYFGVNAFNETGAQSLNLNNQGWNASSMVSSLGANCAYSWQANRNLMVVPQINLAWQHEFLQNPYAINTTMGGTPYSNWSAVPNRDTLFTGVGVTLEFKNTWNTAFFYNAAAGNQNITSQNIFWSAGLKF